MAVLPTPTAAPRAGLARQPQALVDQVTQSIDAAKDELRSISLEIFNNPELIFKEYKACKLLSGWFEARGWAVKRGVYGLETAFEARFSAKEGGRTVCLNAEYDALPGVGHACGHNLIAETAVASAIGLETVMKAHSLPGTLIVMGTPAEETGGGKWIMAKNGAWQGIDACLMTHGMATFSTPLCITKASWKVRTRFYGKSAHAATAPWTGLNACDAIVHAYNGIALLRQQVHKTESIQGCILEAGKGSNQIPDFSDGLFSIRAPNMQKLDALKARVEPIFNAAAAATGCRLELDWYALYEDVVSNEVLAEQYRQYMIQNLDFPETQMLPLDEAKIAHDQPGSSDFGSCSYICPGLQVMFNINATDLPHSIGFREAACGQFAHEEALRAAKGNALTLLDVLINDDLAAAMKAEFEVSMKEAGRWKESK